MKRRYSCSDFASKETWRVLSGPVLDDLMRAARAEFGTVTGGGETDAEDIRAILAQNRIIKRFLCAYMDGLAEAFCVAGAEFSGDSAAREELRAKFGGKRKKLRDCRLKKKEE